MFIILQKKKKERKLNFDIINFLISLYAIQNAKPFFKLFINIWIYNFFFPKICKLKMFCSVIKIENNKRFFIGKLLLKLLKILNIYVLMIFYM
jgi:hypothetical protein